MCDALSSEIPANKTENVCETRRSIFWILCFRSKRLHRGLLVNKRQKNTQRRAHNDSFKELLQSIFHARNVGMPPPNMNHIVVDILHSSLLWHKTRVIPSKLKTNSAIVAPAVLNKTLLKSKSTSQPANTNPLCGITWEYGFIFLSLVMKQTLKSTLRDHSQLVSVGHFEFLKDLTAPAALPSPTTIMSTKKCPLRNKCRPINDRKKCPQVFKCEQLMSARFENFSHECQWASKIGTLFGKSYRYSIYLLSPCLHYIQTLNVLWNILVHKNN